MKPNILWLTIGSLCVVLAGVIGALQQPSMEPVLSGLPTVSPPNSNYKTAVEESVHRSSAEDLTFRYVRQINHTDSICLYTFMDKGRLYYNEAFLTNSPVVSPHHQWIVEFSAIATPDDLKQPISQMEMNAGTFVKHQIFSMVGGCINEPSINLVEITFMNGNKATINIAPNQRFYVYSNVSDNAQIVGIYSIQAYSRVTGWVS